MHPNRLEKLALKRRYEAAIRFRDTRVNQRLFTSFEYAAKSWKKRKRRTITEASSDSLANVREQLKDDPAVSPSLRAAINLAGK